MILTCYEDRRLVKIAFVGCPWLTRHIDELTPQKPNDLRQPLLYPRHLQLPLVENPMSKDVRLALYT